MRNQSLANSLAVVALAFPIVALSAAPTSNKSWYPQARDLCGEFVSKYLKPEQYGKLVTPKKDILIAKFIEEYDATAKKTALYKTSDNTDDQGGEALVVLMLYCGAHAGTMLGAVTAKEAITELNATVAKTPAETSTLDTWLGESKKVCGSNDECKSIARKYYDDAIACEGGNAQACSDKNFDLSEINRVNAQRGSTNAQVAPHAAPQDALMRCLQDAADRIIQSCNQRAASNHVDLSKECPSLWKIIRLGQQTRCGYSAIDSDKPIQQSQPVIPPFTNCTTTPTGGGGSTTRCTQF